MLMHKVSSLIMLELPEIGGFEKIHGLQPKRKMRRYTSTRYTPFPGTR
jgi:hypothetical protein